MGTSFSLFHSSHLTMKILLPSALAIFLFSLSCAPGETDEGMATTYLITLLGNDTLAAEAYTWDDNTVYANVVLRSPRTVQRNYRMVMGENGMMSSLEADWIDPATDSVFRRDSFVWDGDSLRMTRSMSDQTQEAAFAPPSDVLPFIDMVHWPFDQMLATVDAENSSSSVPVFSGTRSFTFEVVKLNEDSATIKHPSRGTMGVSLTPMGTLSVLDAGLTTRKLRVFRSEELDIEGMARDFSERDKEGLSFGALSGRGSFQETVDGVAYKIDYGTPAKRGRSIWGKLVPYGERWRTGANRATHFSTDMDITLGGVVVPAGDYTLFTIPESDGGVLIINKQTGQNGRSYDEEQDLGRTEMSTRDLSEPVEIFTIAVEQDDSDTYLKLQWDLTEYVVPIRLDP